MKKVFLPDVSIPYAMVKAFESDLSVKELCLLLMMISAQQQFYRERKLYLWNSFIGNWLGIAEKNIPHLCANLKRLTIEDENVFEDLSITKRSVSFVFSRRMAGIACSRYIMAQIPFSFLKHFRSKYALVAFIVLLLPYYKQKPSDKSFRVSRRQIINIAKAFGCKSAVDSNSRMVVKRVKDHLLSYVERIREEKGINARVVAASQDLVLIMPYSILDPFRSLSPTWLFASRSKPESFRTVLGEVKQ